jgi:hypothetical protein
MTANASATPGNATPGVDVVEHVSTPKLQKTIDLRTAGTAMSTVKKMTFSPDSRYLGIVESPAFLKTDIVVWDLQLDREQSRIHCPSNYADLPDHDLLWSPDGKVISFGAKRQWDPMTGEALPDNPAIGRGARLNKDGSKLLTIVGAIGEPSYIHIYDTKTWALTEIYVDGLVVRTASWTADDRVLAGVGVTKEAVGKALDEHIIQWKDTALRLIDPSGKKPTKAVWFQAAPTGDPKFPSVAAFPIASQMRSNFATNQVFLAAGKVIDIATLNIHHYRSFDEDDAAPGALGMGFSLDGRLLYLKGASFLHGDHAPIKNSIVDVNSGTPLLQFDGATDHQGNLAVSPDGERLALGDAYSILVFGLR